MQPKPAATQASESAVIRSRSVVIFALIAAVVLAGWLYRTSWLDTGTQTSQAPAAGKSGRRGASVGAAVPVVTQVVTVADFPIRRRTIGILESPATIVIRSRIDSQVLEQHVVDGQIVKKGALLFTLDDREIRATIARDEATIAKDKAALTQAEAALHRTEELIAKRVAPQQQLEQATAAFKAAQQTVEADQAVLQADALKLGYAKLEAPITGRIGAVRVAPGNLASANDTVGLVTLTQMQPLRVSFTLPERDLAALRAAASRNPPAVVRVYTSGDPEPLSSGTLDFVDSSVDNTSGTIAAKATFANEHFKLWPGQYVEVEVDLDVRPGTATVPTVAIQTGQKGPYVFVAKEDHTVEMRKVELAGAEGNRTALKSGLSAGERVVVQGQLRLSQGAHLAGGGACSRRGSQHRRYQSVWRRREGVQAMNISEFCIRHPVATTLMSVALVAGGIFAYLYLPVAALPRVEFPVINVSASLPGAAPDTMANAVATPLIKQFATIAGIDTISATSAQGSTSIAVQFDLNRDIDSAAADIQSAIARVQRQLPDEMTEPPSYRKVNPADAPIMILALSGDVTPLPEHRRLRPAGDLTRPVDDRGRGPGAGVRQPEIRRAHPARPRHARRARHWRG